jgi:hypothetical protein
MPRLFTDKQVRRTPRLHHCFAACNIPIAWSGQVIVPGRSLRHSCISLLLEAKAYPAQLFKCCVCCYVTTRIENERNLMAIPKEHEAQ